MMTCNQWEAFNELVAALYGIKNSTAMRKALLTRLMGIISFDFADFNLSKGEKDQNHWLEDPVVVSIFSREKEETFTKLYETKYYEIDYVNWIFAHHESIAYRESDLINDKVRRKSKFYQEYLSQYDLGSVAGVSIISSGRLAGAITLYKSEKKGDFSQGDIYVLEMLLPHLQNVLGSRKEASEKNKEAVIKLLKYQYGITKKEIEIMRQIIAGHSNQEISQINHITTNTTKSHVANIYSKTGVKSRTQLINFLIQNHFLTLYE